MCHYGMKVIIETGPRTQFNIQTYSIQSGPLSAASTSFQSMRSLGLNHMNRIPVSIQFDPLSGSTSTFQSMRSFDLVKKI
jgi:hypothetical protein